MKLDRKDKAVVAVSGEIFDYAMKKYSDLMKNAKVFLMRYNKSYYQLKPGTNINISNIDFTIVDDRKPGNPRGTNILVYVDSLK